MNSSRCRGLKLTILAVGVGIFVFGVPSGDAVAAADGKQVKADLKKAPAALTEAAEFGPHRLGTQLLLAAPRPAEKERPGGTRGGGGAANFYTDPGAFDVAVATAGKYSKAQWSFKPDNVGDNFIAGLISPLNIDTHAANAPGIWSDPDVWPPEVDNVTFNANPNTLGLAYATPPFQGIMNNILVANTFTDSFDIISGPPAGDNHTAISMEIVTLLGGVTVEVIVYDKNEGVQGMITVDVPTNGKTFLGIIMKEGTIGRINLFDPATGAEGVSDFALYLQKSCNDDGTCGPGENCCSCPTDCGPCECGDGVCSPACGEDCGSCETDCGVCPTCGDGVVNQPNEECDGADDSACPGACQSDCTCPLKGCAHTLNMHDSYGDGWNGASLDVFVGGVLVLDNATVPSGGSENTLTFLAQKADPITTVFTNGSWDSEITYEILDGSGNEIAADGPSPGPGVNANGNCPCDHTLAMQDSYGDGWNGASLDLFVNGNLVLDNATVPPGGSSNDLTFSASNVDTITTVFTGGSWDSEITYQILDGGGAIIASDGPNPGSGVSATGGCPCKHQLDMADAYGDGWNGASLDLLVNGNLVLDDATVPAGGSAAKEEFFASDGDTITTVFTGGSWDSEITYSILDGQGNVIGSDGPSPGSGITATGACKGGEQSCKDFEVEAPGTWNGATCGMGNDCDIPDYPDNDDVVYTVTLPNDGRWTFSLCGSSYDTMIAVGDGCCSDSVGFNDDSCGLQSSITAELPASEIWVTVDGFGSNCGDYTLEISVEKPAACCYDDGEGKACTDVYADECATLNKGIHHPNANCGDAGFVCQEGCVYDNGPPSGSGPASQYASIYPFIAAVADDFILNDQGNNDCEITEVVAWFAFWNGSVDPSTVEAIWVTVYENADPKDPAGFPSIDTGLLEHIGPTVYSQEVPATAIAWVDEDGNWKATIPVAMTLEKKVKYWLELIPVMQFPGQVGWRGSGVNYLHNARQGFPLLGLPFWTELEFGVAFQLIGTKLPSGACCDHTQPGGVCWEVFPPETCGAEPFKVYEIGAGVPIPDADPAGARHDFFVGDSGIITDLDVDLNISHTWVGDLCVILEKKTGDGAGLSAILLQRIGDDALGCNTGGCCGCSSDDIVAILDDEATDPINGACPPAGTYIPESPLSVFDGIDKFGDWSITAIDNAAGDAGILNSWSLHIANVVDPNIEFHKGLSCDEIGPCDEHTGSCCDGCTGTCTDGVAQSACVEPEFCQPAWEKDGDCATMPCEEHTGACCDMAQPGGSCVSGVPESQCPTANPQIWWSKDEDCIEDGGTADCLEHTGACCDSTQPGGSCADDIPESQCPDDNQHQWYKFTSCSAVPCEEHTGSCCDGCTGTCTDDVPESVCMTSGQFCQPAWTKDGGCATMECFEHEGACCDGCTGTCTNNVPESSCVEPEFCQPSWTKDASCGEVLCEEHTGACCNKDAPGGSCEDGVPESQCPVGDQVTWTKDASCDDVNCQEHVGSCCDGCAGECSDDVPESVCVEPAFCQPFWSKDTACVDILCNEHTGACCDNTQPGGDCQNNVPESQCPVDDQHQWYKDTSCTDPTVVCEEHVGACCTKDVPGGSCADDVPESDCDGDQQGWTKRTACADVNCQEHTGACCDHSQPGGVCTDDVPESLCDTSDPQISWTKETSCADVEAAGGCEEHTGACCDGCTGVCTGAVPESECVEPEFCQPTWSKDTSCSAMPCAEHTGACCDNVPTGGECTDDVPESGCDVSDGQHQWYKFTLCSDIECLEHTGACCDGDDGTCQDGVPASECDCVQCTWGKDTLCSAFECYEHTGACCSRADGSCADDVLQGDCLPGGRWYKDGDCAEIVCPPVIPTITEWGLLVLSLVLLAGIAIKFGKRRTAGSSA